MTGKDCTTRTEIRNDPKRKDKLISYGRQWIDETDVDEVAKALRGDFITTGPLAAKFEEDLCELTGAKHAIVCSNGTIALHLACLALDIGENSLGVTSPITFLASANCVEFCGGRADFVDIDSDTLCLCPERLEEYCKNVAVPEVVIPVDFAGVPANLPAIWEMSNRYGFKLIEDAAHAIGTSYTHNGTAYECGGCAYTDLAIFSFHPVKTITTGEGGAVLTNDDEMAERIRRMRSHGIERKSNLVDRNDEPWYYEMKELNFNNRITDFQCALGRSQMRKLAFFKRRRKEIFEIYNEAFKENPGLIVPKEPYNASVCYHLYPLQFQGGSEVRYKVFSKLAEMNIFCQIHYIPVYWQPYYSKKYGYQIGKCSKAETYYSRCLSLPLYPALKDDEIAVIIDKTLECL